MDVSSMLSNGPQDASEASDIRRQSHQYPTRNGSNMQDTDTFAKPNFPPLQRPVKDIGVPAGGPGISRASPVKKGQKHVVFQLIDPEDPRIQARLPMRVMISKHDDTEAIITTVKNFYGLYEVGVNFENNNGIGIIAAYDNFEHDMTVYVRTVSQPVVATKEHGRDSASPKRPPLGAPFEMRPTLQHPAQSPSRTGTRSAGVRSVSPHSDTGKRSASVAPGGKPRPQRTKSKDNSVCGDGEGYSSGDNGGGSVASSRRSKVEQVNAEISVENIVEGGRRKRAFESSELPLFVPPQVPISASISSISPQRRGGPANAASPYTYTNQQTFSYAQALPSPRSYSNGFQQQANSGMMSNGFSAPYQPPARQLRGGRPSGSLGPMRSSNGGIMPTPDPTVGSAISDEDVALQLMRLGDPIAFSHGRTSTSTYDDAFSGKADAASSDGEDEADEDDEEEEPRLPAVPRFPGTEPGPLRKKQRMMNDLPSDQTSGEEYEDQRDGNFEVYHDARKPLKSKSLKLKGMPAPYGQTSKPGRPRANSMIKPKPKHAHHHRDANDVPISPSSMPAPSRKGSIASTINFQHPLAEDEEDLSSKPRCQRCRKSKKGCDRQRPCGRCKDAGIGIEGCISEDDTNGRKGRYGRHMGIPIKKDDGEEELVYGGAKAIGADVGGGGVFLAPAPVKGDRKRKR